MPSSLVLSILLLLLLQANHGRAAILGLRSSDAIPTHGASAPPAGEISATSDVDGNGARQQSGGLALQEDRPGDEMAHLGDVEERNIHDLSVLSHLFARNDTSGQFQSDITSTLTYHLVPTPLINDLLTISFPHAPNICANTLEDVQIPDYESLRTTTLANRKLHGRFLHLTDLHPDEFYKFNSAVAQMCHRKTPKKGKGKHLGGDVSDGEEHEEKEQEEKAGWFGVPFRCVSELNMFWIETDIRLDSECDSPLTLTNLTLDHLHKEWAENIDFVVCTFCFYSRHRRCQWTDWVFVLQGQETVPGENLSPTGRFELITNTFRHDNDNLLPRTPSAIYEMNRCVPILFFLCQLLISSKPSELSQIRCARLSPTFPLFRASVRPHSFPYSALFSWCVREQRHLATQWYVYSIMG